jgi:hypothetical protein
VAGSCLVMVTSGCLASVLNQSFSGVRFSSDSVYQSSVVLFYLQHGSTGTDRCAGNQTNRSPLSSCSTYHGSSGSGEPLTIFQTPIGSAGSDHGSYPIPLHRTDKLSSTLRMHTLRASIFDRTTQTNQKENGIIHQPILFSKQRDYGN